MKQSGEVPKPKWLKRLPLALFLLCFATTSFSSSAFAYKKNKKKHLETQVVNNIELLLYMDMLKKMELYKNMDAIQLLKRRQPPNTPILSKNTPK